LETTKHNRWLTWALQTVSILLVAALIFLSVTLSAAYGNLQNSIREDALWAVYQLDREAGRFATALNSLESHYPPKNSELADLKMRHDILYSRLSILNNSKYQGYFFKNSRAVESRQKLTDLITKLDAFYSPSMPLGSVAPKEAEAQKKLIEEVSRLTMEFLSQTKADVSKQRSEGREQILSIQYQLVVTVVLLIAAMLGLIFRLSGETNRQRKLAQRMVRLKDELTNSLQAAESGYRARSQFMATIGHEIRTPLNAIIGMAELMETENLSRDNVEAVKVIRASGHGLLEMINEILDYSKIENNKLEIELCPVAVAHVVSDVINILRGGADEKRLSIGTVVPDNIRLHMFETDPTRIKQVLMNLLSNALKFTDSGHIKVEVHLQSDGKNERLRFAVTDSGIGINEAGRQKLFQPFSQVDASINRKYGGTGLGLTICKEIVDLLDGQIGVDSQLGIGSTFWFEVPARSLGLVEDARTETKIVKPRVMKPLRILLAEDNEYNQLVAVRMLGKLGQTAKTVQSGLEAIKAIEMADFDLVLMDIQMPEMDGIEATRHIMRLSDKKRETAIYAMTANASDDDRKQCFDVGMKGFLSKPVTIDSLREVISEVGEAIDNPAVFDDASLNALEQPAGNSTASSSSNSDETRETQVGLARVDRARQAEMLELFGEEGYAEVLNSFFHEVAVLMRRLAKQVEYNPEETGIILHTLKGMSLNAGFDSLAELVDNCDRSETPEKLLAVFQPRIQFLERAGSNPLP
jgi:signal transduction histidine kinase/DNA-binding response OmpR family regulator